jgi:hypothetical protein
MRELVCFADPKSTGRYAKHTGHTCNHAYRSEAVRSLLHDAGFAKVTFYDVAHPNRPLADPELPDVVLVAAIRAVRGSAKRSEPSC